MDHEAGIIAGAITIVLASFIWAIALTSAPTTELRTKAFIECVKATQKPAECRLSSKD